MICTECGTELPDDKNLKQCPQCGETLKKKNKALLISCGSLAVILLLGAVFFMTIFVPNFVSAEAYGQFSNCKNNLKNIAAACEMFASDNAGHYPDNLADLTPKYLMHLPNCPAAEQVSYSYKRSADGKSYIIYCRGSYHKDAGENTDFPKFDSEKGLQTESLSTPDSPAEKQK